MPYVRRKYRKSTKPASFAKRVRKVISSTAQIKHATNVVAGTSLDSDIMYFTSPTQNISPGTAINQRIGDQVKLKQLEITGHFVASALANSCVKYRVTVFGSADAKACSSFAGAVFTGSELFQPNTSTVPAAGQYDEKYVRVYADMVVDLNSNISTARDIKTFALNIPLRNQRLNYKEAGSAFASKNNLYILITPHTSVAANVADCGDLFFSYDLSFQDI